MTARTAKAHIGLKELCNLSSSVKSFLGPFKSYKFIYDPDTQESTLTCSAFRFLENLDLTSAVGQLLYETIQAHHKVYRTGTSSLFFLIGAWSKAVLQCLDQGVPVSLIVTIMLEGLNACIEIVDSLHIKLDNVLISEPKGGFQAAYHQSRNSMLLESAHTPTGQACPMKRLSHSRHFSAPNTSCFHNSKPTLPSHSHTVMDLTRSLSHGNSKAMNLVKEVVRHLCESAETISVTKNLFQPSWLELCVLNGQSEEFSSAFLGYATLVTPENYALVKNIQGKSLQVLLVDGGVAENYRHVGFNKPTNVRSIAEFRSCENSEYDQSWISTVCKQIIQAGIDLILVRGDVCQQFIMHCRCSGILVIPHVRPNILQAFSDCTGAELVTYLSQVNSNSIGSGVYVSICMRGTSILECKERIAVNVKAKGLNLATVVISCRFPAKVRLLEDAFWASSYRLHHALNDQKVFPGGGAVELLCLNHLRKLEESAVTSGSHNVESHGSSWLSTTAVHYKGYIYRSLAEGFYKYLSVLLCNIGEYSSEPEAMTVIENKLRTMSDVPSPSSYIFNEYFRNLVLVDDQQLPSSDRPIVYDNVIPKLEAWRRALHLVLIVLQSDAEIITGSPAHTLIKGDVNTGHHLYL